MLNTTVVETPLRKGRGPAGKRKSITDRQRPLWMLAPGGVLMTVVIVIPLLLGLYIAVTDLDQYSLRRWLNAPFVGGQNFVEAVVETPLLRSVWISVSFAVLSTIVTVPLGLPRRLSPRTRTRAAPWSGRSSSFLTCCRRSSSRRSGERCSNPTE